MTMKQTTRKYGSLPFDGFADVATSNTTVNAVTVLTM